MSENIFRKSRADMAIVQSHLSMLDEDRARCIRALGAMKIAEEMYAMLEIALSEMHSLIDEVNDQRCAHRNPISDTPPDLHDGQTLYEIQSLLAKARGES